MKYHNQESYKKQKALISQLLTGAKIVENDIVNDYKQALKELEKLYHNQLPFYYKFDAVDMRKYQRLANALLRGSSDENTIKYTMSKIKRDLKDKQLAKTLDWLVTDYEMSEAAANPNYSIPLDVRQRILDVWCADGKSIPDRIQGAVNRMDAKVCTSLLDGLKRGRPQEQMDRELQKIVGAAAHGAKVLIRTETMATQAKATKEAYLEAGIERVEIIGDAECGGICLDYMDGPIELVGAAVGVELPPYHPNCACSFCAYDE